MLVDSHCHLDFPELKDNMQAVLQRAEEAKVGIMQTICTKMSNFPNILKIAETYPHVYCSIGVHPNEVTNEPMVTAEEIIMHCNHPKVIGIGETGLDFYYEHSPRDQQIESFIEHIKAARETKMPLIIHTRDADTETIEILKQEMKKGYFPGLIHCFSTSKQLAEQAIELGMYISISGIITFKKATELQLIVKDLPLSRLLVETDAPYLAPEPFRGKKNEPSYVRHTAEYLANLKGVSISEVEQQTTENFMALFSKVK